MKNLRTVLEGIFDEKWTMSNTDEFVSKETGSDDNFWHAKRTACWLKHMIEK